MKKTPHSSKTSSMASIIDSIKGGIVVSCQAHEEDGLYGPENMALMAKAAELGGAVGIRADDPKHIAAIRRTVKLPIIGIYKEDVEGYETRITLNMDRVKDIVEAGSDIIALDVTNRPHPYGTTGIEMIKQIKEKYGCLVMADISTFEEGVAAAEAGADIVATTLSGYTSYSPHVEGPDFALVKRLAQTVKVPVICEGRIASPEHARRLLRMGAHAIVVGSMITRPMWITKQYAEAMKQTVRSITGSAYALDIGGTKIAASIVNAKGDMLAGPIQCACPQESRESVIAACLSLLHQLRDQSAAQPIAVGVSTGGTIDRAGNIIYATSSIPDWQGCPLRERIAQDMQLPVTVCNDGNCAAVAEARLGNGASYESTLCLTVGTGLGGGVVVRDELMCGSERMAQCFGHMVVCREGRCKGENAGAAESYISGHALCEAYNERVEEVKREESEKEVEREESEKEVEREESEKEVERAESEKEVEREESEKEVEREESEKEVERAETGKEVGERAEAGDAIALACVKEMGEWLGVALASMCACLNPEVVCIGGSVAELGELILAPAREAFKKSAFATIRDTPIVKAKLGTNAGVIGAALLALDHC